MSKFFIYFIIISLFQINISNSEIINKIEIEGNNRVSVKSIILFSDVDINQNIDSNDLNTILKNLYNTNFFENITIDFKNNILSINVSENPIIQNLEINGVKDKIKDQLIKKLKLRNKSSYVNSFATQDLNLVTNILKSQGYYFVDIKMLKKLNANDTIDLIYNIDLGDKAIIKRINFIGDKKFKDRKLRHIIVSEADKPWKFISNKKYLDEKRINLDIRLLKNFYINNGYYNVKIQETSAQYYDNNEFNLSYNINAGKKFIFNNFKLVLPVDYSKDHFRKITDLMNSLTNTVYSYNKIEDILEEIDNVALSKQYEFINATVEEKIVGNNKIDFIINIEETSKFYVKKINIFGNTITDETVIRQQLVVDEGDAYNEILHNKSINNLKAINIFEGVKSEVVDSNETNHKFINFTVEEKPTGEISAGAGISTSGSNLSFGIKENNYMGSGVKLNTNVTIGDNSIRGLFSITNPNFNYSDRSVTTTLQSTATDVMKDYGYKTSITGVTVSTAFEQYEDFYFSPEISALYESLSTSASASDAYQKQKGDYFDTTFSYGLTYDKRDQVYQPTSGFKSSFKQSLPVISDGYALVNSYEYKHYKELFNDMIGSFTFYGKVINSLSDKDVRVSKRLFMPGNRLRGFEIGKVGPTENGDFIGGNFVSAINFATTLPKFLPEVQNADFKLFFDMGNIWGVDYSDTIDDSSTIRSAAGLAIDWFTPVGPLNFSFSQPITKASTDKTETFRFNLGTTF